MSYQGLSENQVLVLREKFGENVAVYGYSDCSYKEWRNNRWVKFVHAPTEDSLRYFKDNSLDMVFSHLGLVHLEKKLPAYLEGLAKKLKVGGRIIIYPPVSSGFFEDRQHKYNIGELAFQEQAFVFNKQGEYEITWVITRTK